ncbi:MAG: O-antigen polysaccharide polymerase Wzy family protein [Candidatus Fimenecus sp.]
MVGNSLGKAIFRYFQIALFLCSVAGEIIGQITLNNDILLISLGLLLICNLFYGMEKMRERFVFFFFNCACVFFLYGRIFIDYIEMDNWQWLFTESVYRTALTIVYVSVFSLLIGAVFFGQFKEKKSKIQIPENTLCSKQLLYSEDFIKNIQIIVLIAYLLCVICTFIAEIEKPIALRGKSYTDYYASFESSLPGVILSLSALTKFMLCMYLATMPTKMSAFFVLGIYVFTTIPVFIVGQRNPFISAALFAVCYYLLRDFISGEKEKKWFGKFEAAAVVIALPFLFAFLSLYESIRKDIPITEISVFKSILDLFHSQGITFEVICRAINHIDELPTTNFNYTFGSLINYFKGNGLSRLLFGFETYKIQTEEAALYGNNLDATISYFDLGSKYFEGAGLGSSFIIENYVDFGYIGVIIFSFLLGMLLIWFVKNFHKNVFVSYCVLVLLLQLFMVPRSSASGWLVLLIYIPAIFIVGILCFVSYLCRKKYYK